MIDSPGRASLVLVAVLGAAGSAAVMVSAILPPAWTLPMVIAGAATAASTYLYLALRLVRDVRRPASTRRGRRPAAGESRGDPD
jgi:hypothetical protein